MAKRFDVFKCNECSSIVEVLNGSGCNPVCCGKPMGKLAENTVDAAHEKHVPVIEKIVGGYKVSVGAIAHPMEEKHYIMWIELLADGISYKKFLSSGDKPEAVFMVDADTVCAREYCSLHGLWKSE